MITGTTKIAGVFGNPVKHTKSPFIHNALYKKLGLDFVYVPFEVKDIKEAVKAIPALGLAGVNVTVPFKTDVIKHLDIVDENSMRCGAVNTIKNQDGKLYGFNTDGEGFIRSLEYSRVTLRDKKIILIGAGGAAKGILGRIIEQNPKSVSIINRTLENATKLAAKFDGVEALASPKECDFLINATSVGMNNGECPIESFDFLSRDSVVYDLIYSPKKTKLLKQAENMGLTIINGFLMLLFQAIAAFEIFTGETVGKPEFLIEECK